MVWIEQKGLPIAAWPVACAAKTSPAMDAEAGVVRAQSGANLSIAAKVRA